MLCHRFFLCRQYEFLDREKTNTTKHTLGNMNEFQYVIKADEISIFICLPRIQICKAFSKGIDLLIS